MDKKPVVIIADPESMDFYRAIPMWDEKLEFYLSAEAPHRSRPLNADLVIIDCGYNDETGVRLVREIKGNHPGIPVILLTDAGSEEIAVKAFRSGVRDYIKKPVDIFEFKASMTRFLSVKRTCWRKEHPYLGDKPENTAKPERQAPNDLSPSLLRSFRYIKDNLSREITVDRMAREAGLSKFHFCREFKKATGMPPMLFLSHIRIKRSKEYLRRNLPVSTIAMKVGFNDLSTFNRHFKKFTGQTPTEYRNSLP